MKLITSPSYSTRTFKTAVYILLMACSFFVRTSTALAQLGRMSTAREVLTRLIDAQQLAAYVNGGTVVVTGGNSGIGAEVVKVLALSGVKVILCARNLQSAQNFRDSLPEFPKALVDIQQLDLSDLESVQQASSSILSKYGNIDVLINNAGIMALPNRETTAQGIEMQFGTNHVGHHYLTRLLLPNMNENGRVVTVASTAHQFAPSKLDWQDSSTTTYSPWGAYGQSKLANILFSKRLQEFFIEQGRFDLTSVSLHPGVIASPLWKHSLPAFFRPLSRLIANKSVEQGAATTVYCALSNQIQGGAYYDDCNVAQPSSAAEDVRNREELWEYTEKSILAEKGFDLATSIVEPKIDIAESTV